MTWNELTEQISLAVWKIECADVMITASDAEDRWKRMADQGSTAKVHIKHYVGAALIALKERGLISY